MARESSVSEADSATAALFAWGANSYGQLGLGHKEDVLLPQQLSDFWGPRCIKSITGGGGHSAAVTDGGGLFVCGLNKDGQLGLGHTEDVLCFTVCKPLFSCPIRQVACGWDFIIVLTETGQVLSCGSNAFGQLGVPNGPRRCVVPQAVELLREKVVCVAAGLRHALATTVHGSVFQWGTGLASSGRRSCPGKTLPLFLTAKEPSRVTGLENCTAVCVVAGSDHSASLTDTGELYVWGRNKYGQLASPAAFLLLPQRIDARCFQDEKVSALWSGWTHLVAQTETGKVFTWGRADYGQLGRRLESPEGQKPGKQDSSLAFWRPQSSVPSPLHCLTGATEISCGSEHNLAVISGKCCSWGWNEHGMCGDGTESNVWTPAPVQAFQSPVRLLLVGCGAGHSLALCQLPAHPGPCQDLKVTYPLQDATENSESQDAMDRERLEGEKISNFSLNPFWQDEK
ncbi:LOW QUALITY PROTEIN: secretion-regulating guanine nucleotide exchange factor [Onychomys torridus]|uniref:LOW QUALITY PROTEIN: secretion-regulating guanine nucleotide exchange factor n=1 Tax=Onychomys torridus TaxID=38674 RepID=UPI00167FAB1D|nr:LOW QUALITY PROTEIN: secretion-regulating guanine nucleotide exchange factor [Onychomys torridus]